MLNPAVERELSAHRHPWRLVAWLAFVLFLVSLNFLGRFAGETPENVAYKWATSIGVLVQFAVMFGVLLLITIGLPRRDLFALRRPRSWKRAALYTAGVLVTIYAVQAAYVGALRLFGDFDPAEEQGLVPEEWDPSRAAPLIAFVVLASVLVPVVEELTFRGLGMSLTLPWGSIFAVGLTGLLFGLAHGLLVGLPALAFFGLAVGWLRLKTASVYPCMLVHGAYNAIAFAIALSTLG